jgi:hypothetical protein
MLEEDYKLPVTNSQNLTEKLRLQERSRILDQVPLKLLWTLLVKILTEVQTDSFIALSRAASFITAKG